MFDFLNGKHDKQIRDELRAIKSLLLLLVDTVENNKEKLEKIMSKIGDYGAAVAAQLDRVEAAVGNIAGDIAWLKTEVERLGDGALTPADQAILDGIAARLNTLGDTVAGLAESTPDQPPPAT